MTENEKVSKRLESEGDAKSATFIGHARGRPRLAVVMSDAQRAKRYRDKKKEGDVLIKRDDSGVTFNRPPVVGRDGSHSATKNDPSYGMLESRVVLLNAGNMRLSDDLQDARDQIAALKKALRDAKIVTRHEK